MAFVATFHDPPAARLAIVDESVEPYVSLLARREAEFMTGLPIPPGAATTAGFTALWQDAVRPWSEAEKQGVLNSLEELYTAVGGVFPGFAKFEWRFVKTRRGFCGGCDAGSFFFISARRFCRSIGAHFSLISGSLWGSFGV